MPAYLHSIATAVPPRSIVQADSQAFCEALTEMTDDQRRTTQAIYRKSGVESRHSVILETAAVPDRPPLARQSFYEPATEHAPDGPTIRQRMALYESASPVLATESARAAITAGGLAPTEFRNLVTVSCTGFAAPGWDVALVRDALHPGVERTHVGFMGCHGAFNGLRAAAALAQTTGPTLTASCELCTIHHRYEWEPETTVANALFADGAASVVVSDERGGALARYVGSQSRLQPGTEEDMSWRIGDHGFVMTLSVGVPSIIGENLRPWIDDWLKTHELTVAGVAGWALHPGGPRILSAAGEALGIGRADMEHSYAVLRDHGNMSSSTVLFILKRMHDAGVRGPVVALGFGPGLTFEAMLLEML